MSSVRRTYLNYMLKLETELASFNSAYKESIHIKVNVLFLLITVCLMSGYALLIHSDSRRKPAHKKVLTNSEEFDSEKNEKTPLSKHIFNM